MVGIQDFIPEGLGETQTGTLPIGGNWAMNLAQMNDPQALYRMAAARDIESDIGNQRMVMGMKQLQNMGKLQARLGQMGNFGLMSGAPQRMGPGMPGPHRAVTGAEEYMAGMAHETALSEAQNKLMDWLMAQNKQEWYEQWAPVILGLVGAATGGLGWIGAGGLGGASLGSTLGSGVGQAWQNYG